MDDAMHADARYEPINLFEYEALARQRMAQIPWAWDYYQGGSDDEVTLRSSREAFERLRLRPRVLVDVRACDLRTSVLGTPVSMPILVAPTAGHGLAHPDAECATARAVRRAGTLMVAAMQSTCSLEEIAEQGACARWLQLYVESRGQAERLVRRAERAGYQGLVITVDGPRRGNRERDVRNHLAERLTGDYAAVARGNFASEAEMLEADERSAVEGAAITDALTWEIVPWLRSTTALPIVLKGILTAEDARLAVEHGVDGIIVSNHGGRQLDGAIASIEALPEVVEAVGGRCEVYVDGGIRRGTDVLKALALGAHAVLIGRPILWGLAVNGEDGVARVLDLLRAELELAMALCGCPTVSSISRALVKWDK